MLLLTLTLAIICSNLILGLVALKKNPRSITHILFLVLTLVISLWAVTNYFSLSVEGINASLVWIRIVMIVAVSMFAVIYLLASAFPMKDLPMSRWHVLVVILVTGISQVLAATPLVFADLEITAQGKFPIPGPGILVYAIVVLGFLFLTLGVLLRKQRKLRGIQKTQMSFFLFGIAGTFIFATITNFLFVNVLKITSFVAVGPAFSLILVGSVFYAIIRLKFLDISLLVARTVTYTILIVVVAIICSIGFSLIGGILFRISLTPVQQLALVVLNTILVFSFPAVSRIVEKMTGRFLYRNRYDSGVVLSHLGKVMASSLRLEELTHGLLEILLSEVHVTKGAFILLEDTSIIDVKSERFTPVPTFDEKEIKLISDARDTLRFDALDEGSIKDILRKLEVSTVVHLRTGGDLVGLLILGEKESGDVFVEKDYQLLEILAPEAAVAIQNAHAYEEIRRFNITLQEEVDSATGDLRRANERLQELDKLKDEFVSLASHELRTPMTAIRSYIWMALSGKGGKVEDKQKFYLDRAYASTNRLIKLVNDMLNISRIESGRVSMKFEPCDPKKLIADVLGEIQPKIEEQKLHLTFTPQDPLPSVLADIDKIKEVCINFLGNAIKFTPPGGDITITARLSDGCVRFMIQDTGVGMKQEDIPKLFTKFSTVQSTNTVSAQAYQSTGLGLYISKSIVTMHGGEVTASSEGLGKGSTFSFTLPLFTQQKQQEMQSKFTQSGLGIIHNTLE